ncbi:SlyX family protein [Nostoc sp. WHI]|nr:SlyX family protein [Nostoc sp. WHI]
MSDPKLNAEEITKRGKELYEKSIRLQVGIISLLALSYLMFSLISPIFLKQGQQPRKIETPDIIVIAIVLLFNSGLLNRIKDFGISKDGGFTANFEELKQEVNEQKKQIDELQAQQLEQLGKQQKNLEQTQAFMFGFLLAEKDYEKIDQLYKHSKAKTSYEFYVSNNVGDELRRLRDFKLIKINSGYISDAIRASNYGKKSIDLTKYFHVTDLGEQFLTTREKLQFSSNEEMINAHPHETPKVE